MNAQTTDSGQRLRILLVDDEIGFLEVMRKRLMRRDVDVQVASGGAEAVRLMREAEFDAVVVDLKMEDMDGIELLRILRLMDPEVPVIMLTGHGSEQAAREGMALGAADYLSKPCELEDLLRCIRVAAQRGGRPCAR